MPTGVWDPRGAPASASFHKRPAFGCRISPLRPAQQRGAAQRRRRVQHMARPARQQVALWGSVVGAAGWWGCVPT